MAYEISYLGYRNQDETIDQARTKAKEAVGKYLAGQEAYSAAVLDFLKVGFPKYF